MYAIIDIETTGGKYNEEAITEVAILKHDGSSVIDQFSSLVNPQKKIMPYVVKLTGITDKMVRTAPCFHEVAKRIIEITKDCTLVAHNTKFDYRILKNAFKDLGYNFKIDTLDTVELSKELLPNQESYSLGKLTKNLGIPLTNRHRAFGDALATQKLFDYLLEKDSTKKIFKKYLVYHKNTKLKYNKILSDLKYETGVYYLFDKNNKLFYLKASKNINQSLNQHFLGKSVLDERIRTHIFTVKQELTGSFLIAQLKELKESKKSQKNQFYFSAYIAKNNNGFNRVEIHKINKRKKSLIRFTTLKEGQEWLTELYKNSSLKIPELKEGAEKKTVVMKYNRVFNAIIKKFNLPQKSFLIIDDGRTENEKAIVYIKNGIYKGFGYATNYYQMSKNELIETIITLAPNTYDAKICILEHLKNNMSLTLKNI